MRELIGAGIVEQQRRGRGRSNIYTLRAFTLAVAGEVPTQEPQFLMPNKTVLKPRQEEFDSYPHFVDIVDNSDSTTSTYIADPPLPEEEKIVCPAPIARLVDDVGKEMRDKVPTSSRTRVARIHHQSGISVNQFMHEVLACRTITRNRLGRIQKRNRHGQAEPMAYLLKVLENRVNPPVRAEKPRFKAVEAPVSPTSVTKEIYTPEPVFVESRASTEAREVFWTSIRNATGLTDLRSYCHAAGRPPVYDDVRRSIQILRERGWR
jgi:hypothetical protein